MTIYCFCRVFLFLALRTCWGDVEEIVPVLMNDVKVTLSDQYLQVRATLPAASRFISSFEPKASAQTVHHMLMYGCTTLPRQIIQRNPSGMSKRCGSGERLIYGWAKDAPGLALPDHVGVHTGDAAGLRYITLEIHYLQPTSEPDSSGVLVHLSSTPRGILAFATHFTIPPRLDSHEVSVTCCYSGPEPLRGFAFRVHTHTLGRSVRLDRVSALGETQRLLERSPELTQIFEPLEEELIIQPGSMLRVTCRFNSSEQHQPVHAGPSHHHEMCNLYLMYHTKEALSLQCYSDNMNYIT
eukprot:gene14167-16753_t